MSTLRCCTRFHFSLGDFLLVAVQEELAFVFEMLQQFEDALVQYDELDALFTQYVLNFGAGGKFTLFSLLNLSFSLIFGVIIRCVLSF